MSGRERGPRAALLRGVLSAAEPFYAAAAAGRNWLFDAGLRKSHRLPRPVVSVGNITTGGTGKTPVVRWLAGRLRDNGRRVAVLARGYGARPGHPGDEQLMLQRLLSQDATGHSVTVVANPDRVAAANRLLREQPGIDAFVLDDGFQHRRVGRDLDIVLVSATNPFGYGHVLPRGLLREPLRGLRRAGAIVITHADQVSQSELSAIERRTREHGATAPVYRAIHAHAELHVEAGGETRRQPLSELRGRSWFAACGIGDPDTFLRQLQSVGGRCAGYRWFADHHRYTADDLAAVRREALAAGAEVVVTTEKDWAKMEGLSSARDDHPPVWRVDVQIRFLGDGEQRLWGQVWQVVAGDRPGGGRTP
jgi:tetraacyldisaccharide 4'-kinase